MEMNFSHWMALESAMQGGDVPRRRFTKATLRRVWAFARPHKRELLAFLVLSVIGAVLTVATPVLAYSGLVMTEVLFYPLLVTAAWAGATAIARPTRGSQILLLVAFVAVCATRIQAIVLVPALVTAALLDA